MKAKEPIPWRPFAKAAVSQSRAATASAQAQLVSKPGTIPKSSSGSRLAAQNSRASNASLSNSSLNSSDSDTSVKSKGKTGTNRPLANKKRVGNPNHTPRTSSVRKK